MKTVIRQSVGIDISKEDFEARICGIDTEMELSFNGSLKFENNKKGFKRFVKWVISRTKSEIPLHFIMEATGIYYESLAYYLHKNACNTHVLLPNMSKHFFNSLNAKSKTDKSDAKNLAILGVERKFDNWSPSSPFFKKLRSLTRYNDQLKEQKTVFSNMLHSYELSEDVDQYVIKDIRKIIADFEKKTAKSFERIEAHICISFTAYTIYKELERVLYKEKTDLSLKKSAEITHNMYQITYTLPESSAATE